MSRDTYSLYKSMIIHCNTVRFISEVLEHEEYSFLFKDLIVVDLGCNIGAFSLYMLPYAKQIYAVDIAIENIELFNKTIKDNSISNIQTFCFGISGKTETRKAIKRGAATDGGWGMDDSGDLLIDTYSLFDFMNMNGLSHIDVLKIDVEGAEAEILEAKDFPYEQISTIIGEYHGDIVSRLRTTLVGKGYTWIDNGNNHFTARR